MLRPVLLLVLIFSIMAPSFAFANGQKQVCSIVQGYQDQLDGKKTFWAEYINMQIEGLPPVEDYTVMDDISKLEELTVEMKSLFLKNETFNSGCSLYRETLINLHDEIYNYFLSLGMYETKMTSKVKSLVRARLKVNYNFNKLYYSLLINEQEGLGEKKSISLLPKKTCFLGDTRKKLKRLFSDHLALVDNMLANKFGVTGYKNASKLDQQLAAINLENARRDTFVVPAKIVATVVASVAFWELNLVKAALATRIGASQATRVTVIGGLGAGTGYLTSENFSHWDEKTLSANDIYEILSSVGQLLETKLNSPELYLSILKPLNEKEMKFPTYIVKVLSKVQDKYGIDEVAYQCKLMMKN